MHAPSPEPAETPPPKAKRPLPPETRTAMRQMYESGQFSNSEIARRVGVTEKTVRRRAEEEGWSRPPGVSFGTYRGPVKAARPEDDAAERQRQDIMALLALLRQMSAGLGRILAGKAKPEDAQLLPKSGSVIDAFGTLAAAQARLIALYRETAATGGDTRDPMEFAARLRQAQREMAALSSGGHLSDFSQAR
jgi:transposase-like protein